MMQPIATRGDGGESELLGAQQRRDGDVAAGLQLSVSLHAHAAAQIVQHQHLLGFGKPQFPRNTGVFERRQGEAPVPPSYPLISTTSACALATPAATVPTPTSATSLTEIRARGFTFFKS